MRTNRIDHGERAADLRINKPLWLILGSVAVTWQRWRNQFLRVTVMGNALVENSLPAGPWVATPRWAFWRKRQRRVQWYLWRDMHRPYWRYANDVEVANDFLEKSFAD
jgi:hypothetical protein